MIAHYTNHSLFIMQYSDMSNVNSSICIYISLYHNWGSWL